MIESKYFEKKTLKKYRTGEMIANYLLKLLTDETTFSFQMNEPFCDITVDEDDFEIYRAYYKFRAKAVKGFYVIELEIFIEDDYDNGKLNHKDERYDLFKEITDEFNNVKRSRLYSQTDVYEFLKYIKLELI
jgi:hypothetical protein